MKTRSGFVSNSSSSSFIVMKSKITGVEAAALLAFDSSDDNTDGWNIYEDGDCIRGFTIMDNCALSDYLKKVGFKEENMEWEDY